MHRFSRFPHQIRTGPQTATWTFASSSVRSIWSWMSGCRRREVACCDRGRSCEWRASSCKGTWKRSKVKHSDLPLLSVSVLDSFLSDWCQLNRVHGVLEPDMGGGSSWPLASHQKGVFVCDVFCVTGMNGNVYAAAAFFIIINPCSNSLQWILCHIDKLPEYEIMFHLHFLSKDALFFLTLYVWESRAIIIVTTVDLCINSSHAGMTND